MRWKITLVTNLNNSVYPALIKGGSKKKEEKKRKAQVESKKERENKHDQTNIWTRSGSIHSVDVLQLGGVDVYNSRQGWAPQSLVSSVSLRNVHVRSCSRTHLCRIYIYLISDLQLADLNAPRQQTDKVRQHKAALKVVNAGKRARKEQ